MGRQPPEWVASIAVGGREPVDRAQRTRSVPTSRLSAHGQLGPSCGCGPSCCARTRAFFAERGFLEVETPLLSADMVVDRHLDPLSVVLPDDPRQPDVGRRLWLQTSPEFAMKRLLAAGGEAIYQITRAFRGGEAGPLHNPEFTIVEWYRRGDRMAEGMQLLSDLGEVAAATRPGRARLRYAEAFEQYAGVDPHRGRRRRAGRCGSPAAASRRPKASLGDDRDGWLNLLLADLVEPQLGVERPTILYDYPASQAALAAGATGDPPVAERFELYVRRHRAGQRLSRAARSRTCCASEISSANRNRDARRQAAAARGKPAAGGDGARACRLARAWRWASIAW